MLIDTGIENGDISINRPATIAGMGRVERAAFVPDLARAAAYDPLFEEYVRLHDHFGRGGSDVMKRLKAMRRNAIVEKKELKTALVSSQEVGAGGEAA